MAVGKTRSGLLTATENVYNRRFLTGTTKHMVSVLETVSVLLRLGPFGDR